MANVMSLKQLRNKPSRNGFDLSRKNIYSAKVGELLPVACIECIPGDKFKINVKNLTRTMPINTAAYTRIREYFDFFFVPTELLWHRYNTWVSQMVDNNQHATGPAENVKLTDRHPYFSMNALLAKVREINTISGKKLNPLGYNRSACTAKLLNYLDYGHFAYTESAGIGAGYSSDVAVNPFPLFAYQKIYADYFRNSQWENAFSPSFNIDYIKGETDLELPISSFGLDYGQFYDLRYCNWNKDLFMGILPNSQYGDAASISLNLSAPTTFLTEQLSIYSPTSASMSPDVSGIVMKPGNGESNSSAGAAHAYGMKGNSNNSFSIMSFYNGGSFQPGAIQINSSDILRLRESLGLNKAGSGFTILALRQAEALQKWQEITQSQQKDYKSQMEAHFGVKLSDAYSDRCQFIDGVVNTIDINEVVNNNITGDNAAEIAGKGIGVGDGNVSFSTDVHGYFMCIYHAVPILDYAISGVAKHNLKTYVTDYAIPELDAIGMSEVPWRELSSKEIDPGVNTAGDTFGYAPRYYDYKTAVDRVHGAFVDGGLEAWVAPVTDSYLTSILDVNPSSPTYEVNYKFFKVNPNVLNPIFAVNAGQWVDTDQLLVNCSFDIKAVRNLDYNGLPY